MVADWPTGRTVRVADADWPKVRPLYLYARATTEYAVAALTPEVGRRYVPLLVVQPALAVRQAPAL